MLKFIANLKRQLLVFLVALLVVVGIVAGLWVTNVFGWRQWRVQEAQAFIGATLPAGATDIQFTTRNQYTRIIWLRFNLPANTDLTPFLKQMGISDGLKAGFTPFPAINPQEAAIVWWQPTSSTTYSGVFWNTGTKIIEVLVDQTSSTNLVLYIRAYAMSQK